jgi:glycosyltransferase involved in cell wall biosynthesis
MAKTKCENNGTTFQQRLDEADRLLYAVGEAQIPFPSSLERRLYKNCPKGLRKRLQKAKLESEIAYLHNSGAFETEWYLAHNPDVAALKLDPVKHYIEQGESEGRSPSRFFILDVRQVQDFKKNSFAGSYFVAYLKTNDFAHAPRRAGKPRKRYALSEEVRFRLSKLSPDKETVLVVTHEMTRTGAPTIALNAISYLRKEYNVVTLALRGGAIESVFNAESDVLIGPISNTWPDINGYLRLLLTQCQISFAIVNSVESIYTLPILSKFNIAILSLIHEFAAYTSREKMEIAGFYSDAVVFPSEIVRANAVEEISLMKQRNPLALCQGLCQIANKFEKTSAIEDETENVRKKIRPEGWEDAIVVLGTGTVELRKGVDLFFLCAAQALSLLTHKKVRFVWVGQSPAREAAFAMYLKDQFQRSGFGSSFAIVGELKEIDRVYESADIFFMSSRLDPMPLVAQEAMAHGLPVVCFERATGIAELLAKSSKAAQGIIPYLDVSEAARRLRSLIEDEPLRLEMGQSCKAIIDKYCRFDDYGERIVRIAKGLQAAKKREIHDREIIRAANILDLSFFGTPPDSKMFRDPAWWYVHLQAFRYPGLRKPVPGFHPGIYAEAHHLIDREPLAHYLENGSPAGPWKLEVIQPGDKTSASAVPVRAALHVHLFYADMAREISTYFFNNTTPLDLYITIQEGTDKSFIESIFAPRLTGKLTIVEVPNRGRDIGAFLTAFARNWARDYEIVGHVHTKRTLVLNMPEFVREWSDFLLENTLGLKHRMMDLVLARMAADPSIGIVYPDDPNIMGWTENLEFARGFLSKFNLNFPLKQQINFPVGTFFWARTAALKKLFEVKLQWEDYPPEPLPYDGSLLHALERLLPIISESEGYRSVVTHVPHVTRLLRLHG